MRRTTRQHSLKSLTVYPEQTQVLFRFKDKFAKFESKAPEEAKTVIEEEIEKLNALEPASSEFNVTRNYLEWLTSIPWGHYTEEKLDVQHARQVCYLCRGGSELRVLCRFWTRITMD